MYSFQNIERIGHQFVSLTKYAFITHVKKHTLVVVSVFELNVQF